ncbi:hypothetical protein DOTSEDRAFT_75561 [Dothistroma septosporum NZE10]|uniref:Uncharacterized protein n=1 Tax=Dothistroma septosporum (strain NZE10 / CBS 128990) TaxID=675120 RepID=M2YJ17_DOTSN|nr:hypothetical protein DOTSEDRAFT_75561 [Dothistroma septosporum NZE10]
MNNPRWACHFHSWRHALSIVLIDHEHRHATPWWPERDSLVVSSHHDSRYSPEGRPELVKSLDHWPFCSTSKENAVENRPGRFAHSHQHRFAGENAL